eukprot:957239-Rhodomonas_salina.1
MLLWYWHSVCSYGTGIVYDPGVCSYAVCGTDISYAPMARAVLLKRMLLCDKRYWPRGVRYWRSV